MAWLSRLIGNKASNTTVKISGKEIEIFCSTRADNALANRDPPLLVEIELAFACFARKAVRFHEASTREDIIKVNEKLSLLITTIVPDTCEAGHGNKNTATTALRSFLPKSVRIDYIKGKWVGEYEL